MLLYRGARRRLDAMNLGIFLYPHSMREMKDTSVKGWSGCTWKKMSPESTATGGGGVGTDETTLTERVEPTSFAAAGDRLPVRLSSSK